MSVRTAGAPRMVVFVRGSFRPQDDAVSRSLVELVLQLQERGITCRILCATVPVATPLAARMAPGTVVTVGRPAPDSYDGRTRVRFVLAAAARLATWPGRIDAVVSLEDPTAVALSARIGCLFRRDRPRRISWLMDLQSVQHLRLDLPGLRRRVANRLRVKLDALSWGTAHQVVVLGDCMADVVRAIQPRAAVSVVPIWQDGDRLSRRGDPAGGPELTVMYHGHATFRQPMDDVVAAADLIASDGGGVRFLMVARGPSIDWLREEVRRSGLPNVEVTPEVPDLELADVLALGDVHLSILDDRATGTCVPSKTYTAMAVGRPCLAVGAPQGQASRDVVTAGAGYAVRQGDPAELAERIRALRDSPGLRVEMGEKGHAFFRAERDLPRIAERWAELLAR